ncbi:MAG TPA: hypothetical protein VGJ33_00545 [Candidatus Angelobacter sp.]|jgi:hypothetical protein
MQAANLGARKLNDDELFLEAKRAINPLAPERKSHIAGENFLEYRSAREQLADVSILNDGPSSARNHQRVWNSTATLGLWESD